MWYFFEWTILLAEIKWDNKNKIANCIIYHKNKNLKVVESFSSSITKTERLVSHKEEGLEPIKVWSLIKGQVLIFLSTYSSPEKVSDFLFHKKHKRVLIDGYLEYGKWIKKSQLVTL